MPQPFSLAAPRNAGMEMANGPAHSILRKPGLAILAMQCIASWSHVERFMLHMYVELAGGNKADAAAVYLSLDTRSAKSKVLNTLAARRLSDDNLKLFNAISAVAKSAEKSRDKIAHWAWGTSEAIPDALLLMDPRTTVIDDAEDADTRTTFLRENTYVYKEDDFKSIIDMNARIISFAHNFRFILRNHPANAGGRLYDQLCREPEIAEKLDHQARRDRAAQSE